MHHDVSGNFLDIYLEIVELHHTICAEIAVANLVLRAINTRDLAADHRRDFQVPHFQGSLLRRSLKQPCKLIRLEMPLGWLKPTFPGSEEISSSGQVSAVPLPRCAPKAEDLTGVGGRHQEGDEVTGSTASNGVTWAANPSSRGIVQPAIAVSFCPYSFVLRPELMSTGIGDPLQQSSISLKITYNLV
jgi:hypothetical protein